MLYSLKKVFFLLFQATLLVVQLVLAQENPNDQVYGVIFIFQLKGELWISIHIMRIRIQVLKYLQIRIQGLIFPQICVL